MNYELLGERISCPYCGETIEISVDTSLNEQQYIEDCQVCCRPIELQVSVAHDGSAMVHPRRSD